jgi:hypothetical protein
MKVRVLYGHGKDQKIFDIKDVQNISHNVSYENGFREDFIHVIAKKKIKELEHHSIKLQMVNAIYILND